MPVFLWLAALLTTLLVAGPVRAADAPKTPAPAAGAAAPGSGHREEAAAPLEYPTLTHQIFIDSLRAGSHDDSGHNDYVFSVTMYGLVRSAEERNLEFAKRKKVTDALGTFGGTKIDSLAVWHPDEKAKDFKDLKIDGNTIRELAARTMMEFKVPEDDVAVEVEVVMMKKNKRFFFFGDDQAVASAVYFPIPATKFDTPLRTNQTLTIADDKGTLVKLSVRYDKPATPTPTAPKTPPPPAPEAGKKP